MTKAPSSGLDEVRVQSEDREADRADNSADDAVSGGQGDQVILDFRLPILD